MLARADVTYAQGYALGRPGPAWPAVDEAIAPRPPPRSDGACASPQRPRRGR